MDRSGFTIEQLNDSDTAVYVGLMCNDYSTLSAQDINNLPTYNATGAANSNASARLSYFFNWHGPCLTIDTACSSSLVAVHQAVQTLRQNTSRVAIAAGTNLILSPQFYVSESNLNMLSPDGRCRMWDKTANGYARGEGVACIMLKKLSHAIADGDTVEAIIRETGVNQDGKTKGLTMPSAKSQAALISSTYRKAGLDPRKKEDRCQYFEAHGTGTAAGDPHEAEAIDTAFFTGSDERDENDKIFVGSIKTLIGHTEGTAGLAGIIKACLSIKHGLIPRNLHFTQLSETVEPFAKSLDVVTSNTPWPQLPPGTPRRVSVNNFGFGGTNAHAIIESYGTLTTYTRNETQSTIAAPAEDLVDRSLLPFLFSAASEKSLTAVLKSFAEYLSQDSNDVNLRDLAYTLGCRRSVFQYRAHCVANSRKELISELEKMISAEKPGKLVRHTGSKNARAILGVFTGQGAQWPCMGAALIETFPVARKIIQELDDSLASLPTREDRPGWTILDELLAKPAASHLAEAKLAQPVVCAVQ